MSSKGTSAVLALKEFYKRLSWRTTDAPIAAGEVFPSLFLLPSETLLPEGYDLLTLPALSTQSWLTTF